MKLFSTTGEYVLKYKITCDSLGKNKPFSFYTTNRTSRIAVNIPLIVKKEIIFILGSSVSTTHYDVSNFNQMFNYHPLYNTLYYISLTTTAFNYGLFKPINKKLFILNQTLWEFNSDKNSPDISGIEHSKLSSVIIFGWKKHDRRMFGIGASRGYKGGSMNYMPFVLYNYIFPNNMLWFDVLLPIRGSVRYSFNSKNILSSGFEIEGTSYYLKNMMRNRPQLAYNNLELRRSELRVRLNYDFAIYKLVWMSVQAGYRINNAFNLDEGDFYRGFGSKKPYVMENKQTPSLYFTISLNLVAP